MLDAKSAGNDAELYVTVTMLVIPDDSAGKIRAFGLGWLFKG